MQSDHWECDARVVEDALAFIDAFYAPSSERNDETEASDEPSGSLLGLRAALRDLCDKLLSTTSVPSGDRILDELRRVAHVDSGADLDEIQRGLRLYQQIWVQKHHTKVRCTKLHDRTVANVLRRRLDEVVAHAASGASERPLVQHTRVVDQVADCAIDPLSRGVVVRFRSGRYIPFKLSILMRAARSVVAETSFPTPGQTQATDFDQTQDIIGRRHLDEDGSESVTALRRVDMPDGTVLICWSTIQSTTHNENGSAVSLFRHAKSLQMGWVRVGRLTSELSSQPRVFIENVCDVAIQPANDDLCEDQELDRNKLERFRSLMHAQNDRDGVANRQRLENRMLEMTLASSRSPQTLAA